MRVVLGALLVLAVSCAEAPEDRFRELVRGFGPPRAEMGFTFEGHVRMNGAPVGTCRFSARPDGEGGWSFSEHQKFRIGALEKDSRVDYVLTSDFRIVRGENVTLSAGGRSRVVWKRTEDGARVTTYRGEEPVTRVLAIRGHPTYLGIAATVLLARLAPRAAGDYRAAVFHAIPEDGSARMPRYTVSFDGPVVRLDVGAYEMEFRFSPEGREPLSVRIPLKAGTVFELLPGEPDPAERLRGSEVRPPARTAEQAALITCYAMASGEEHLLDRIVNWPQLLTAAREENPRLTEEEVRRMLLRDLGGIIPRSPEDRLADFMRSVRPRIEYAKLPDGTVAAKFPAEFSNLRLTLARVGQHWFVARLPEVE
jgi:hypothetical protein